MICPRWEPRNPGGWAALNSIALDTYQYSEGLHEDGRQLIRGWFLRGWKERDCSPHESFQPFIFTWIAFNGWASCVTNVDADFKWKMVLMRDEGLNNAFRRLYEVGNLEAEPFHSLWPIFKARRIRQQGLLPREDRRSTVEHYLNAGVSHEPNCWRRHQSAGEAVPIDWFHTLLALYNVRCNLFHGEKAIHLENDQTIVSSAFRVSIRFLRPILAPGRKERADLLWSS